MLTNTIKEHIEIVQRGDEREARIAGTRIRVHDIVFWHHEQGWSPEMITEKFSTLSLADVYASLVYYLDHRDEIDREIADERAFDATMLQQHPSELRSKLQARMRS